MLGIGHRMLALADGAILHVAQRGDAKEECGELDLSGALRQGLRPAKTVTARSTEPDFRVIAGAMFTPPRPSSAGAARFA
ncbi:MAG: hypothetical protein ACYC8T_27270, partial [Myxococcaceae bacterium]